MRLNKMNKLSYLILSFLLLFLFSACSTDEIPQKAPLWINDDTVQEDDSYIFTAVGRGYDREEALSDLGANMSRKILEYMGFIDEDFNDFAAEREYIEKLIRYVLENDENLPRGLSSSGISWFREEELSCASQLTYDKSRFEVDKSLLRGYLAGEDYGVGDFLSRARELDEQGFAYSAFLYDLKGADAGYHKGGLLSGFLRSQSLDQALIHIKKIETPPINGADQVYLGARRSWPFTVNIPLSPVEQDLIHWIVDFEVPGRGGDIQKMVINLASDNSGASQFSYPFPAGEGRGVIRFSLNRSFWGDILTVKTPFDGSVGTMIEGELARLTLDYTFPIKRDRSVLNTAIVIDDRDVAGKLLSSRTTENSVFTSLQDQSYFVEVIDFDLERVRDMSELEMVREFNSQYDNNYDIILFCEAGIRDYTQKGDLYQVTAGAVLYEVDLWEHRVNRIDDITSSVTGSDPAQLVTSAFIQLGNDIAQTCLQLNEL